LIEVLLGLIKHLWRWIAKCYQLIVKISCDI